VNLFGGDAVELSEAEFEQIVMAKRGLLAALALEEKFKWKNEDHFVRNNVFDRNSFEHLNVAVSVKRYRALFMDA